MAQNRIHMPGAFGGLMRYDEEYKSRFMMSPSHVIGIIIALVALVIILKLIFPIHQSSLPNNFIFPLLNSLK